MYLAMLLVMSAPADFTPPKLFVPPKLVASSCDCGKGCNCDGNPCLCAKAAPSLTDPFQKSDWDDLQKTGSPIVLFVAGSGYRASDVTGMGAILRHTPSYDGDSSKPDVSRIVVFYSDKGVPRIARTLSLDADAKILRELVLKHVPKRVTEVTQSPFSSGQKSRTTAQAVGQNSTLSSKVVSDPMGRILTNAQDAGQLGDTDCEGPS